MLVSPPEPPPEPALRASILVSSLSLLLTACGGGGGGGADDGVDGTPEVEPNDTMASAMAIVPDATILGSISAAGESDIYKVTIPTGGQRLRIETFDATGTTCAGINTGLLVYNAAATWSWTEDNSGIGYCSRVLADLPAGEFFIEVTGTSAFSYVLKVTVPTYAVAAETEPNDDGTPSSGLDFAFGTSPANGPYTASTLISGAITPYGDDDVFAVRNPTSQPKAVWVETLETFDGTTGTCTIDTFVYAYDSAGASLGYNNDGGIGSCSRLAFDLAAGATAYVRVIDYQEDSTIPGYLLAIDL